MEEEKVIRNKVISHTEMNKLLSRATNLELYGCYILPDKYFSRVDEDGRLLNNLLRETNVSIDVTVVDK